MLQLANRIEDVTVSHQVGDRPKYGYTSRGREGRQKYTLSSSTACHNPECHIGVPGSKKSIVIQDNSSSVELVQVDNAHQCARTQKEPNGTDQIVHAGTSNVF